MKIVKWSLIVTALVFGILIFYSVKLLEIITKTIIRWAQYFVIFTLAIAPIGIIVYAPEIYKYLIRYFN